MASYVALNLAGLISAPKDGLDGDQDDENDEPSDGLKEQDTVCKIKTEGTDDG